MVSRITVLATLASLLSLHCKPAESDDTGSSSGSGSSGTGMITTVDPTTTDGTTTLVPPGTSTTEPDPTTSSTGATTTPDPTTTGDNTTGPVGPCVPMDCLGKTYACGDCVDNDGDGKIDLADPECITPCDDLEDTFATGLPGDNMDPCKQDCFFDGNSGNDACDWNLACDPANPGGDKCPYDANLMCDAEQPADCGETCNAPNGCDCFGCCTVDVDGMSYDIFIGDKTCTLDKIEDCETCTKNDSCEDPCVPENCEICFGGELPPGCDDPTCDTEQPCTIDNMGGDDCAEGFFCQTGCCTPLVPG